MATLKILLDTRRQKKDQTYPLKIRIYHGKDSRNISLGISVKIEHWNEQKKVVRKSHLNASLLNHKIQKVFTELQAEIVKKETNKKQIVLDEVKSTIFPKNISEPVKSDFFTYGTNWWIE